MLPSSGSKEALQFKLLKFTPEVELVLCLQCTNMFMEEH